MALKTAQRKNTAEAARPVATRAAILAAAEEIFARSGLAGARTEAIARAAGVNKAMLYYYFKSKDHLYEAVVEDHFREFNNKAIEVLETAGAARTILLRYVGLHFDFISSRHRYASLFQQMMLTGGRPLERLVRKYFLPRSQALHRLLERGMRSGEFRPADVEHMALSIAGLIVFYFSAAQVLKLMGTLDAYSEANLRRRKEEVMNFIRFGLFADPRAEVAG